MEREGQERIESYLMRRVVIVVVLLFLLSGCWDLEEADRMDYVHGIGVDYKNDKVTVYIQIVNLGTLGNAEGGSSGESDQVTIASASADDINSAVFNIYKSAQRRLYWGHDTFVILTEEALEQNLMKSALDLIDRYRETRYRIRIFSTKDDLEGLLKASPAFDGSPIFTRLTDIDNTYEQSSRIKDISIRELLISLHEPGHNGMIPAVGITDSTWETEKEPKQMIESVGVAIATPNNFNGFITGDDINGLRWMQRDSKRNNVSVYKDGKPASEVIIVKPKVSFDITKKGEKVIFNATVNAKGIINEVLQDIDQKFLVKELEKNIKKEIMQTYKKALEIDADIYRLSEKLYRRDLKTWKKIEKKGEIKLDENSLQVKVNIDLVNSKLNNIKPIVE